MTVIRVHELAKKMGVESKDLITVLEKMGIKEKTPTSGLDEKETKSLIEKLKAVRKEKEKTKKEKPASAAEVAVSLDERRKKAAALIGKFSSTLEKPGTRPKPAPIPPVVKPTMPAPPVIAPVATTSAARRHRQRRWLIRKRPRQPSRQDLLRPGGTTLSVNKARCTSSGNRYAWCTIPPAETGILRPQAFGTIRARAGAVALSSRHAGTGSRR